MWSYVALFVALCYSRLLLTSYLVALLRLRRGLRLLCLELVALVSHSLALCVIGCCVVYCPLAWLLAVRRLPVVVQLRGSRFCRQLLRFFVSVVRLSRSCSAECDVPHLISLAFRVLSPQLVSSSKGPCRFVCVCLLWIRSYWVSAVWAVSFSP